MKTRNIAFGKPAKTELYKGAETIADAVVSTFGPKGKNVAIFRNGYNKVNPIITKDGVTVAKNVFLGEPMQRIGADIMKHASIKTAKLAGDGTTTSMLFALNFMQYGIKMIERGMAPVDFKRLLENQVAEVINLLKQDSRPIKGKEDLKAIATIAANNDPAIGEIVAEVFELVGGEGVVEIQDSMTSETYVDMIKGTRIDRGYLTPHMLTDIKNMRAEFLKASIFLTTFKINTGAEIDHIIKQAAAEKTPLVIIAEDFTPTALMYMTRLQRFYNSELMVVKAPHIAEARRVAMDDLGAVLGAIVVKPETVNDLSEATASYCGFAEKVIITKDTTTFIEGGGKEEEIAERESQIRAMLKESKLEFEIDRLKRRLGALIGGVAVIYVGAHTEVELSEKRDRIDDSVRATRSAIEEGVVDASAFWLFNTSFKFGFGEDEVDLFTEILRQPLDILTKSVGIDAVKLKSWNTLTEKLKVRDLNDSTFPVKELIDPAKVIRCALENACSAATTLLLTEVLIWDDFTELPGDDSSIDLSDSSLFDA